MFIKFQNMKKTSDSWIVDSSRTIACDEYTKKIEPRGLLISLSRNNTHIQDIIVSNNDFTKTEVFIMNDDGKTIDRL